METTPRWYAELLIEITTFLIGLIGNILVLFIVHEKKAKKTVHGIFVTSLAIADLVLLCFDSPATILRRFDIVSDTYNCRVHLTVATTGYNAGLFTITSMALHRCHMVTNPWKAKLKRTGALVWVTLVWLAAFTLVIPLIVVNKPTELSGCVEAWPSLRHRQAYTASLMTLQYLLPLFITAVCYLRIWLFLKKQPVVPRISGLSTASHAPEQESGRESVEILKTVAAIVVLFVVLLLPTQVAWMLLDFNDLSYKELWFAADILTRLHSCLNPVVYGVMNRQYRRRYAFYFSLLFCCRASGSLALEQPQRPTGNRGGSETMKNTSRRAHLSEDTQNSVESRFAEGNMVVRNLSFCQE